ncbi:MAG: ATP-binding protein [Woeseiaceae bacterium]|nr:ATP-binding protein [Woeseiaceae bacterium]
MMYTILSARADNWRLRLLAGAMILLFVTPAAADPWYEHYANAELALENEDWALAVEEINEALKRKGDSGARVRSYGMNVTSYFPYLHLGIAYYHLGQLDAASQAFDTEARLGAIEDSESATQDLLRYRSLLADAKAKAAATEQARIRDIVGQSLTKAQNLAAAGELVDAMSTLDRALAVAPDDADAASLMRELRQRFAEQEDERQRQRIAAEQVAEGQAASGTETDDVIDLEAEVARARLTTIQRLLAEAEAGIDAGVPEDALSAANRVLSLDPGNDVALTQLARAYAMISDELLGTRPTGNLPPAVRFVDLRRERDDGGLVETIRNPSFRLNGVVIDTSPVDVEFADSLNNPVATSLNSQPLGDFYITEFSMETEVAPGASTFRLVATDSEGLSSSSEYLVVYIRPFFLAPWFHALVLLAAAAALVAPFWRRYRRREQLTKRKFNPYVAGAPVLDEEMFFGRRELVDRILQTVHNNSLLIYGERRIGKTSVQHQLKKRLEQLDDARYAFFPVYVDLQGTPETKFFQTIAEDIFQELAPILDELEPTYKTTAEYSYRDFIRDVRAVLRTLQDRTPKRVKLVLLMDEVDELNAYDPRINQKLRSLFMKSFAENLVAVVSGVGIKKQWEREGSPWYNFFEEIELKPFAPHEARELIERPIAQVFRLDDGVVDRIISLTDSRPYLIQKLCIALITRLHEQGRRRISLADVDTVSSAAEIGGAASGD